MREDAVEEDYVDDPIRLFDYEQSRVCYTELADIFIEDPGFVLNTTKKEEERFEKILSAFRNETSLLPIRFFENDRNVELLSECCPLTINIVDCGKFVTCGEKRKDVEISSNVTDVSQNLIHNYTNMLPKKTMENTTEVVKKQVCGQINLKSRETTSTANLNNQQGAIINKNKCHTIKNSSVDANVLNCPKLGTSIKPQNDELNVNRDYKQLLNNLNQISNKRKCDVEKEVNNVLEKQLADIRSAKINKPRTKVIEHCQYNSISRTDIATTTVNLISPKKKPTNVNNNYDEQIMKFKMSDINRNESLKTRVISNQVQKNDSIQASRASLLPPKLSQTKTLTPDASINTQYIQNKPCTRVMCDKRLFSANKEIPHYHNTSLTNTVINRQQEHNSNKTDCAACTGNIYNSNCLNKDINISNRNMNNNYISNNNNIPSNLWANKFISPCGPNYVISQQPKDNMNSPNMRITIDGYENLPGLRDTSKGMSVIQTNNDQIPPLLNQNHLINANNLQNFPIGSVLFNNFPQIYIQPPPPPPPLNLNIYNGHFLPPINNIVSGAENLPLVVQDQPVAHSNINCLIARPNLPPQTQVSQAQSCFMENKEGMINIRPSVIQKNVTPNISNLIYRPGTSTSIDQLNQSIKRRGYEDKNTVIPNKHPHLVKALEGQPMEKNPEDNNTTKDPRLMKALEGQAIEKKPKDNNTTRDPRLLKALEGQAIEKKPKDNNTTRDPRLVKALEGQAIEKKIKDNNTTRDPRLVKALEGQAIEKKPKDNNTTRDPRLLKALEGQAIEKKPKDNNTTRDPRLVKALEGQVIEKKPKDNNTNRDPRLVKALESQAIEKKPKDNNTNRDPRLVKALESQAIEKNRKDNNTTRDPRLLKALEGQAIEKKPKDNNTTMVNSNVMSTVNNKSKTVLSNSAIDKINKAENTSIELNENNQNEPTKSNKGNNTVCEPKTSISDYKIVNNDKKSDQKSDNINKPAKRTTTTEDIKQNQLKTLDISKPYTTNVGYSPPILPIPSYQKVFDILSTIKYYYFEGDKMYVNTENTNDDIDYDTPLQSLPKKPILKKADKRKIEDENENEKLPRKITISEYKERGQSVVNNKVDVTKVRK